MKEASHTQAKGEPAMRITLFSIVALLLAVAPASATDLEKAAEICRENRGEAVEVAAKVTDDSVVLSHASWEEPKTITRTVRGRPDFEDMRLTIKNAQPNIVFFSEEQREAIIAQPMMVFDDPNCFVTRHTVAE